MAVAARIGSRGSALAITQSRLVAYMLARAGNTPDNGFPIESFVTSGIRWICIAGSASLKIVTAAKRAFLAALNGSCRTPTTALATIQSNEIVFLGELLTPDGKHRRRHTTSAPLMDAPMRVAQTPGERLAAEIREEAGAPYKPDRAQGW